MKKLIILLCFLSAATQINSQLLTENFEYTDGDLLTDHGWISYLLMTNPLRVTSPGLIFSDYAGSGIGNAAQIQETGQNVYKPLISTQDTGSIYVSMMVNVTSGRNGSESYFASLLPSNTLANFVGRIHLKLDLNGNLSFGTRNNGVFYGTSGFSKNNTYLLVLKYNFISGLNNDELSLFVFDGAVPSVEPAVPYVGPLSGEDIEDIARIGLFQGTASDSFNITVDGIYADNYWNNEVLPVELTYFNSLITGNDVTLNWTTASELNNSGFDLERKSVPSDNWTKIANIKGSGNSVVSVSYTFTDRGLNSGNYKYRLKQKDYNGNFGYFNLRNEVSIGIPANYELSQNYPNPFNPSTKISFSLPSDGSVNLKIFDMSGKEIKTIVDEVKTAGYYSVNFYASDLSSGVYIYRLRTEDFTAVKKMSFVK